MLTVITAFFGKAKLWIIGAAVFVAALVAAYVDGRMRGNAEAKGKVAEAARKAAQKARGVENEVNSLSPDGVRNRLDKWVRD